MYYQAVQDRTLTDKWVETMDLLLVKLIFTLRVESAFFEPNQLFHLKKIFEEAFRCNVCRGSGACQSCRFREGCPFHAVFGQQLSDDPVVVRRHQKPPLPFAFHTPLLPARLSKGGEFELGLVMVGSASGFYLEFCQAIERVFRPGDSGTLPAATVVRTESAGCSGFRSLLCEEQGAHDPAGLCIISLDDLLAMNILLSDRIAIRILTPLRNICEGRAVTRFSFSSFLRPLLRRISSLSRYYYGNSLAMDYKRLAAMSESVEIKDGRFRWIERSKDCPEGLVGEGTLCGPLADFHPALLLGEYLNCGKGAAYGMGRYEIVR